MCLFLHLDLQEQMEGRAVGTRVSSTLALSTGVTVSLYSLPSLISLEPWVILLLTHPLPGLLYFKRRALKI